MYTHSQQLLPITQCIHDAPKGERRRWTFTANAFVCCVFASGASVKIFRPKRLNLTLDPAAMVRWSRERELARGRLPLFREHQSTAHHSNYESDLSHATVANGRNWSSIYRKELPPMHMTVDASQVTRAGKEPTLRTEMPQLTVAPLMEAIAEHSRECRKFFTPRRPDACNTGPQTAVGVSTQTTPRAETADKYAPLLPTPCDERLLFLSSLAILQPRAGNERRGCQNLIKLEPTPYRPAVFFGRKIRSAH